jgi:hypothetical protein
VSGSPETVVINPFPNCDTEGGHRYTVPVERHLIVALIIEPPKVTTRSFRVAFECPISAKPFAVTLRLTESVLDRIQRVGKPELELPTAEDLDE